MTWLPPLILLNIWVICCGWPICAKESTCIFASCSCSQRTANVCKVASWFYFILVEILQNKFICLILFFSCCCSVDVNFRVPKLKIFLWSTIGTYVVLGPPSVTAWDVAMLETWFYQWSKILKIEAIHWLQDALGSYKIVIMSTRVLWCFSKI